MVLKIKSNSTINPLIEFLDNSLKNDKDTSIIMQHIASKAIKIPAGFTFKIIDDLYLEVYNKDDEPEMILQIDEIIGVMVC